MSKTGVADEGSVHDNFFCLEVKVRSVADIITSDKFYVGIYAYIKRQYYI